MVPDHIIIHHSLTKDGRTVSWDAIRRYHVGKLYWHDIGYHFGIERVGRRYEILCGRMMTDHGAHCIGLNGRSLGICFLGNFDNVPPPAEQWDLGVRLAKALATVCRIPVANVRGHRAYATWKSCPGLRFDMGLFRRQLE